MATSTLKIKMTTAAGAKTLSVTKSTATLGSAPHCDVRLSHASVDAEHARAWLEGGRLWVQDLGSAHGTYLNGSRLPAMKPMLVRDLDTLKIGESPEILAFDKPNADPVRAPRVATPVNYEATLTEIRPSPSAPIGPASATPAVTTPSAANQSAAIPSAANPPAANTTPVGDESRLREERARVSRELAELRLQLQMAQLEKSSHDDLRASGNELKAELSRLEDERRAFKDQLAQARAAEAQRVEKVETELRDLRARTERELREMRDHQGRALGQWKLDVVTEVNRQVRAFFDEKAQALIKTPVTAQMLRGFESEVAGLVHAVILEEDAHGGKVAEITRNHAAQAPPPGLTEAGRGSALRKAAGAGLIVALIAGGIEYYRLRQSADARQPASASHWRPAKTNQAKASITDNVIYTEKFVETIDGPSWAKARGAELARAPWNFDERTVAALLEREKRLVHDLVAIQNRQVAGKEQDNVTAMHTREAEYTRALQISFQNDAAQYLRFVQTRTATLDSVLRR